MYGSLPDVAGSNELGEYNRFDVKPRKGCWSRWGKKLCCGLSILTLVAGAAFVVVAWRSGWFAPHVVQPPACPFNGNRTNSTRPEDPWFCQEPNSGFEYATHIVPLAFHSTTQNSSSGIGTFSANADYGNATGATFRDKCHLGSASDPHAGEHDDCHVLVGLLMYYVHSPPLVFQLMSVGLYVDPVPARTALAGYKNREEAKVWDAALAPTLMSSNVSMTQRLEYSLKGFPFGDKIPTEMITSKQRVNVEAHWYGNSTTPAHKKALLDKYISVCYPNQYVRAHDVSVLTWNIGQRALSCTTNGAAYASITGPGANTLAASVMLTVLEMNENDIVSLLPFLWKWP